MVQTRSRALQSNTATSSTTINKSPSPSPPTPPPTPPSSSPGVVTSVPTSLQQRSSRAKHVLFRRIYYDPLNPASFSSPRRLYIAARSLNRRVSVKDVIDWLRSQRTYVLHRYTKTEFNRRKVLVPKHQHQYQADLMFVNTLEKDNDGVKYLMIIIDCFSRFLVVVPMKEKSAKASLAAIKLGFKKMKKIPKKFQTDDGSEFFNNLVSQYFKTNGVIHFSSSQHDVKAQMAERVIRTLREKIMKYMFANKSLRYITALPNLVESYNNRKHSAFHGKFAPSEINDKNYKQAKDLLYKDYLEKINKEKFKFNIGDVVLLAFDKKSGKFGKMTRTFKDDEFIIFDRLLSSPPVYRIKYKSNGAVKKGKYYAEQLQLVDLED